MDPHPVSTVGPGRQKHHLLPSLPGNGFRRDVKPSLIPLLSNSLPLLSVALTSLMEAFATKRQ